MTAPPAGALEACLALLNEMSPAECPAEQFLLNHGPALLAALREVEKLRVRVKLADHAVSRWVPCPDHRDKTDALVALDEATRIADKSKKIDRERIVGRAAVAHLTTIRHALAAPAEGGQGEAVRPSEQSAYGAVCQFLREKLGEIPDFRLIWDGDESDGPKCGWAFWIEADDTTSYVHNDLSIEWYGTAWEATPPAASVDVSDMPSELRWKLDNFPRVTGVFTMSNDEYQWFRKLIDSAGGAKGEDDQGWDAHAERATAEALGVGGINPNATSVDELFTTPQPAEGDGAVADALMVVNDAANDARHAGDYAKANALVRARVTLYRASTRPAATAVVQITDEMVERACKRYAFREDGAAFPDAYSEYEVLAERHLMRDFLAHVLAAAPAAPKGEDGAIRRAYQAAFLRQGHSDDLLASLERDVDAALATGEQP